MRIDVAGSSREGGLERPDRLVGARPPVEGLPEVAVGTGVRRPLRRDVASTSRSRSGSRGCARSVSVVARATRRRRRGEPDARRAARRAVRPARRSAIARRRPRATTSGASGRYIRCSKARSRIGTTLELGASIRKKSDAEKAERRASPDAQTRRARQRRASDERRQRRSPRRSRATGQP